MRRAAASLYALSALLSAGLARSAWVHAEMTTFRLKLPQEAGPWLVAGCVFVSILWLALVWRTLRPDFRFGLLHGAALAAAAASAAIAATGIQVLEFELEKGDSDLRRAVAYTYDLATWETRAEVLRAGIFQAAALEPLPERTPLNAARRAQREYEGYVVENVSLETIPGYYLAGNLYRPSAAPAAAAKPVVLVAHGHFPRGRGEPDNQRLAATLARMGCIVFLYDMAGWGDDTQVNHRDPRALTLQLWNSMRVLDFLLALPDADPERTAMTGASGGGTQTILCAAADPRVRVVAPVVMVSSWMYGGCPCESGLPIHRGNGYVTNNAEIAMLAAPRPQLIVSDGADWTRTVPTLEFPYMQRVYALYGAGEHLSNAHFPMEGHDLGPSKRAAVYEFLVRYLGLDVASAAGPGGEIDESAAVVEEDSLLRFFDAEHPRPDNALQGWEPVMAALRKLQSR